MSTDSRVQIINDLDFTAIKNNLAAFIANNSNFTDYNFNGSGISFLLDVLSANTHYNAFFLNMAVNENFIDTAVTRSSIVSLAKNFGYTPKSKTSSTAQLSFTIVEPDNTKANGNTIFLYTSDYFTADNNGTTFVFSPTTTVTATSDSGVYTFTDVEVQEGLNVTVSYPVTGVVGEKFLLNNFDVDLSSISVTVQQSVSDTRITTFQLISDILTLTPETPVFYLFETVNNNYSIEFGDGILGMKPSPGNIVNITFKTSLGSTSNGCSSFSLATVMDGGFTSEDLNFTNIVDSYGGAEEEAIDSVRSNALQNFRTQGRAVTANDYSFFISRDYPLAETISVWGGQDNDPPIYGKVFISFKPADGFFLSNAAKTNILQNIIKSRNIVSIIPEIIDPTYLFIQVTSVVRFNQQLTTLTANNIASNILAMIENYNNSILTQFGTQFNFSKFVAAIDDVDVSIINNSTNISLRSNFPVVLNKSLQYTIDFQNSITPGTVKNSYPFQCQTDSTLAFPSVDLYMDDDGFGNIRIYMYTGANLNIKSYLKANAGTVNYITGKIVLNNFIPSQVNSDNTFDLIIIPSDFSIVSKRNTILTILPTDTKVSVILN